METQIVEGKIILQQKVMVTTDPVRPSIRGQVSWTKRRTVGVHARIMGACTQKSLTLVRVY